LDQFSKTLDKYKKIPYNIEVLYKQAPLISRMSETFREYAKGGTLPPHNNGNTNRCSRDKRNLILN
jgi:hypothetical protein